MTEASALSFPLFARVTDNVDNEAFYDVGDLCLIVKKAGNTLMAFFPDTGLYWYVQPDMVKFLKLKEA